MPVAWVPIWLFVADAFLLVHASGGVGGTQMRRRVVGPRTAASLPALSRVSPRRTRAQFPVSSRCRVEAELGREMALAKNQESRREFGLVLSQLMGMAVARSAFAEGEDASAGSKYLAKVFFDVSVNEGETSRVVIGVYNDGLKGQERFLQLTEGAGPGLDYRRSLFTFISPDKSFIKNAGVGSITGLGAKELTLAGGKSNRELLKELDGQSRSHNKAGIVSLVVRNAEPPPPPTKKLVAEGGRLVEVEEQEKGYVEPNGSAFIVSREPTPSLDYTNLVVGEVIEGMDVIEKLSSLPTSKPKGKDDPFYKVGKSIGDSRAVFMSTRFGRPFARVQIVESGKL